MTSHTWRSTITEGESLELDHIQKLPDAFGLPRKAGNHHDDEIDESHNTSLVREINQEDTFPDGGYGWVCVLCVFGINISSWGISAAYGIFLAHYLSTNAFPGATPLQYAFIAGLSVSQSLLLSPLITTLKRHTSTQTTLVIGIILQTTALIGASYASKMWHLFLSFGLCYGWGMGFFITSTVSIIPQWFSSRRSLANGIATSGVGVGGIIYSLGTSAMIQHIGLPWTWRVLAITSGAVTLVCTLLVRDRSIYSNANLTANSNSSCDVKRSQKTFEFRMLQRPELVLFIAWGFFSELGYVVLWFSLPAYAASIGLSAQQGSVIGALLNVGLVVGRPITGYFSDRHGRLNVATLMSGICGGICLFIWVFAKGFPLLCIFAILGGMVGGTFWGAVGPVGAEVVGLKDLPNALSLTFIVLVFPATFAEAIALQLRRSSGDVYLDAQLFTGFMYVGAAICAWSLRGWKVMKDEQDLVAKRRREDHFPYGRFDPDVNILSSKWMVQLLKGLVAWKQV